MTASTTVLPISNGGTAAFRTYTNPDGSVGALHGLELAGVPVSAAVPIPVSTQGTTSIAGAVSFVGTPAVAVAFPGTQAVTLSGNPAVAVTFPTLQPVSISGTATVAGAVSVTGTAAVAVANFPATQPVSFAGTQTVTGAVSLTGTPAVAVAFPATQPVSLAAPVAVQQADVRATGTLNAATLNAAYTMALGNGEGVVGFAVSGLTAAAAILTAEASNDGTTWAPITTVASSTGALSSTLQADMQFRVAVGGHAAVRLRVSTAGTGTITVSSSAASTSSLVGLSAPLPSGTNNIGRTALPTTSGRAAVGGTTIAAASTYQTVFPAGTILYGAFIQNPAGNSATISVDIAGATGTTLAGTSQDIAPGQTWQAAFAATNNITVFCPTANVAFRAGTF